MHLSTTRAALAALSLAAPGLCTDKLYTVSSLDNMIREVDPTTFTTIRQVAMTAAGSTINWANGLALHPLTNELFVLLTLSTTSSQRRLGKVDPVTGVVTIVGNTGDSFAGLSFDLTGTLYGVTGDGATVPETLYRLDTTTGAPTLIMALGNGNDGETIAHIPGTLELLHVSGFGTKAFEKVNPIAFTVTPLPITGDPYSEGLGLTHFAGSNFLMSDLIDDVFLVAPGGLFSQVGTFDHSGVKGMAFVPAANTVPFFRLYGAGCPDSTGHIAALAGSGTPSPSGSVNVAVFNGPGQSPAVLTLGAASGTVAISPTCSLQNWPIVFGAVIPVALAGTGAGNGTATIPLQIPAGFVADVYLQVVVVEVPSLNLAVTNPLQMHVR